MKQQLTEAYEGEHCNECGRSYGDTVYSVPDSVWAVIHERAPAGLLCPTCALDRLARLVERLLPGVESVAVPCPTPTGPNVSCGVAHYEVRQVWDEGIVEAVLWAVMSTIGGNRFPNDERPMKVTRAVLSAIAQLAEAGSP